jgi:uncharacterized membrane protein
MANQPWFDEVQKRLAKNDLPPSYIRRFMDELADHFQDLTEETMSTETNILSRLGEPNQVADAAIQTYRLRTFFGRHPFAKFWVFAVSPVAAMFLVFVLLFLGVLAFYAICGINGVKNCAVGIDPTALAWAMSILTTILPAALLTILYCRWAKRFGIGQRWMLVSSGVLAVIAMLSYQSVTLSDVPGQSQLTLGFSLPPGFMQCIQLIVPLAIGFWFVRRTRKQNIDNEQLQMAT